MIPPWVSWMPSWLGFPAEAPDMRADEIHQEDAAEQMAAGEDRNFEFAGRSLPPDEQTLEIAFLHRVDVQMHLGEGACEHEQETGRETVDRQLQRADKIEDASDHLDYPWGNWTDWRNFRK